MVVLVMTLKAVAQDTIPLNTFHSFEALFQPGYSYFWWYEDSFGNRTDFNSKTNTTENYFWDSEGEFELFVQGTDENGCLTEIISKKFIIGNQVSGDFKISAGRDTTIGICNPYQLSAVVEKQEGITYSYLWQPGEQLENATSATPVFIPGNSTVFVLTVTNSLGISVKDSVEITVSDVIANAGEEIYMYKGDQTILDGTGSSGVGIQYNWMTQNGNIVNGENTAHPVVNDFGTYYLEVTDSFGCMAIDSVNISRIAHAPVATDDYDTTKYRTEVKIQVLNNDTDEENSIDPSSLKVTLSPLSGTAYVDFDDYTIHYLPDDNFSGTDNFEYQICNTFNNCDRANVYVLVTGFKFFIPEAFSPNGDGINDYFEILGIEYYENNFITIINRWGNKVYEAKNYGISTTPVFWDGKSNTGFRLGNEELPSGTYFYILDLGNGEKRIAGSVYLDR